MTHNPNDPEGFEALFNALSPDEQMRFFQEIGSVGPSIALEDYIITDRDMTDRLDALVERYGAVTSTHSEDLGDFGIVEDTRPEHNGSA